MTSVLIPSPLSPVHNNTDLPAEHKQAEPTGALKPQKSSDTEDIVDVVPETVDLETAQGQASEVAGTVLSEAERGIQSAGNLKRERVLELLRED